MALVAKASSGSDVGLPHERAEVGISDIDVLGKHTHTHPIL